MSPKAILIAFVIVSLLLIGVMFLAVDGRNNATVPKFETTTSKSQNTRERYIDSLKIAVDSSRVKAKDSIKTDKYIDSLKLSM